VEPGEPLDEELSARELPKLTPKAEIASELVSEAIETAQSDWLRGVDLNHRPLGYE
jgi:hypothetical protein